MSWGTQRQEEAWGGQGREEERGQRRGHSPLVGAGLVEEGEGDRAGHLRPHFPGAVEHGVPVKEALEVLGLGLVPWERHPLLISSFIRSRLSVAAHRVATGQSEP